MKKLNSGRSTVVDPVGSSRTAFLVEASDVNKTQPKYLGVEPYTFQEDDVGRLIEVVRNMSPGAICWWFGSTFDDLRKEYPDHKPYVGAPSAQE